MASRLARHGGALATTACLLLLYAPIVVLIALSFNAAGSPSIWRGLTTRWYAGALRNHDLLAAAGSTLVIAVAAMAISVVLGTALAIGLWRRRSRLLDALSYLPTLVPDIVLAVALLSFYNLLFTSLLGVELGRHTVVLAHTVFGTAFVAIVVRARLRNIDVSILEASLDLGADETRTLVRVLLPTLAPAIVAGALIAFTLSVDEFIIAYFTAGAEVTLPIYIYSSVRFGLTPEVNALATMVIVSTLVLVLVALRLRREELG